MIAVIRSSIAAHLRSAQSQQLLHSLHRNVHVSLKSNISKPINSKALSTATNNGLASVSRRNYTLLISCAVGAVTGIAIAEAEASPKSNAWTQTSETMDAESQSVYDEVMTFLGLKSTSSSGSESGDDAPKEPDGSKDERGESFIEEEGEGGPGKPVEVPLDPEVLASLPVVPLSQLTKPSGEFKNRKLVSHDGIVYDITEFIANHPGGKDLVMTAVGLDLSHFFNNYTVHGESEKAAQWLAPMAVGKLSEEDAVKSKQMTNAKVHVERRHKWLNKARRRIVLITATLPLWMTVRTAVRMVGLISNSLGRWLAYLIPVTVPGLTYGAEPLKIQESVEGRTDAPSVAVIGGGIAGCGAAWALRRSGFKVTLYEARKEISGNARTFEWDFSPYRSKAEGQTVKSCCSVTAWPPLFYKNYTCLLNELKVETVHQPLSWFLNSKVPGASGTLWAADPTPYEGSLRNVMKKDFEIYGRVVRLSDSLCNLFTMRWAPWRRNDTPSMYDSHTGIGLLNPMNIVPLYTLFKSMGGSDLWWDVVFTPHYTASFLVDELRPFPAVFGPLIEAQIPLLPNEENTRQFQSEKSERDCNILTCQTWKGERCKRL